MGRFRLQPRTARARSDVLPLHGRLDARFLCAVHDQLPAAPSRGPSDLCARDGAGLRRSHRHVVVYPRPRAARRLFRHHGAFRPGGDTRRDERERLLVHLVRLHLPHVLRRRLDQDPGLVRVDLRQDPDGAPEAPLRCPPNAAVWLAISVSLGTRTGRYQAANVRAMKVPLSWLKEHLDTNASLEAIAAKLSAIGLEVESVEDPGEKLKPFTIARVLEAELHPNADRLRVCRVEVAKGHPPVEVVCGAPNARTGMIAVFAPVGTYIPGTKITLDKRAVRGVVSHGMLVSERELELSDEHEGIIELEDDKATHVGERYVDVMGLNDQVIDVKLTPNRPDCTGVRGIARDLAAAGRKIGVQTDARYRFERGVDPAFVGPGLNLATDLLLKLAGGKPSKARVAGKAPESRTVISFDFGRIE